MDNYKDINSRSIDCILLYGFFGLFKYALEVYFNIIFWITK